MPECEFEEKEYETQMHIELARPLAGRRYLTPAGQHLEKLLGFDAAADPDDDDPIWSAMEIERPAGVRLLPEMFADDDAGQPDAARLPLLPVSLLLQFKRPYRIGQRRGGSPPAPIPVPIYRVQVDPDQHAVLRRLEASMPAQALVRYAAPAFHTVAELEVVRLRDQAVERSTYAAPSVIDLHTYWYYEGPGITGWANPEPEELAFDDASRLLGAVDEAATVPPTGVPGLAGHLLGLSSAVRTADNTVELLVDRWIADVRGGVRRMDPGRLERLRQLASISTFAHRRRLVWLMAGSDPAAEDEAE